MNPVALEKTLRDTLTRFNSETGTIHRLHEPTQLLRLIAQVGHQNVEPPRPPTLPELEWDFLRRCFDRTPGQRPYAADLSAWTTKLAAAAASADAALQHGLAGVALS